jgi:preprotein translocase subunit SecD
MSFSVRNFLISGFGFWIILAGASAWFLEPPLQVYREGFYKTLRKNLRFGIDLVGGTYITLEVQTDKAIEGEYLSKLHFITNQLKNANKQQPVSKVITSTGIELTFSSVNAAQEASQLSQNEKDLVVSSTENTVTVTLTDRLIKHIKEDAVSRNVEVLRTRLNKLSVEEVSIAVQGDRRIVIELPDVSDPQQAKAMIGKAAILEFKLVQKMGKTPEDIIYELDGDLPGDMEILPSDELNEGIPSAYFLVPKYSEITGKFLKDAHAQFVAEHAETLVAFEFTSEGGDKFYDLTSKNIGRNLAVVLDGVVITAPVIQAKIGASGTISGHFTPQSAKSLALLLKSGAFVAPVTFEEERQVGPSLGHESIRQGLLSCIVGLILLFIFGIVFYRWCGILAFLALLYNLLLIVVVMSFMGATLTLPGIAGLVLTIGMAIDASILIYEQMKDALAHGAPVKSAVKSGFSDAMVVILDANITTFIVGAVLYYFGTGPVRGFAVTMMLGIVSTLITGLFFLKSLLNTIVSTFNIQKLRI